MPVYSISHYTLLPAEKPSQALDVKSIAYTISCSIITYYGLAVSALIARVTGINCSRHISIFGPVVSAVTA